MGQPSHQALNTNQPVFQSHLAGGREKASQQKIAGWTEPLKTAIIALARFATLTKIPGLRLEAAQ